MSQQLGRRAGTVLVAVALLSLVAGCGPAVGSASAVERPGRVASALGLGRADAAPAPVAQQAGVAATTGPAAPAAAPGPARRHTPRAHDRPAVGPAAARTTSGRSGGARGTRRQAPVQGPIAVQGPVAVAAPVRAPQVTSSPVTASRVGPAQRATVPIGPLPVTTAPHQASGPALTTSAGRGPAPAVGGAALRPPGSARAATPHDEAAPPRAALRPAELGAVLPKIAGDTVRAVSRRPEVPVGLLVVVVLFVLLQDRIDRRDPKLAGVRLHDDEPLSFGSGLGVVFEAV